MLHNEGGQAMRAKIWFPKQQRYDIYVDGMFMMPNNIDTTKEDYSLLPPDDSFIPTLAEAHGSNYFDPNTGHLYLIVKEGVLSIKTQPIVVLKLGMTVPIENFFEENVVANLAGLLGIDPSNIRVTNIVREGSTGRKRSAGETVTGVDFAIGPPPSDTLGDEFLPEEYTYTTVDPDGVTENPAYTTQSTAGPATTEWVEPANYLNYDALQNVQANLANVFQTGGLGSSLGLNITGLTMEEPLPEPEAPPPYEGPEARAEVLELTYAEQLALNNTATLEALEPKALAVPDSAAVGFEPDDVEEMKVMKPVTVYVKDTDGKMISVLGDESDPWTCTVTKINGTGDVMGNTTVPFIDGIATFNEIYMTQAGDDYVLGFDITYPDTNTVSSASSLPFSVGGRPLGLKLQPFSVLIPQNSSFSVSASVWDEALDQAADAAVLAGIDWDCYAYLTNGNISGTQNISVATGSGVVMFDDLLVEEVGMDLLLMAQCESSVDRSIISATSPPFYVHNFPSTGLMRQTVTTFDFSGPLGKVSSILAGFEGSMGTATCNGCPAGLLTSADQKPNKKNPFKKLNNCWSPLNDCE